MMSGFPAGMSAAGPENALQRDLRIATSAQIEKEVADEVAILADSCFFGREFGTGGACGASFYIQRQLADAGYEITCQTFVSNGRTGRNIVAVSPGIFDSYIVVGAYYDGYGVSGGKVFPGADANASGVAAMLSVARFFRAVRQPGSRTGLIFVAFDGHCDDLSGSRAFVNEFIKGRRISLMVNLDSVGTTLAPVVEERPDYIIVLGGEPFAESLGLANRTVGLHMTFDYYGNGNFTDLFYRRVGDQREFLEKGIPSVMFTSGITMNTNKPEDAPGTLDYKVLALRIRLLATWISSFVK